VGRGTGGGRDGGGVVRGLGMVWVRAGNSKRCAPLEGDEKEDSPSLTCGLRFTRNHTSAGESPCSNIRQRSGPWADSRRILVKPGPF